MQYLPEEMLFSLYFTTPQSGLLLLEKSISTGPLSETRYETDIAAWSSLLKNGEPPFKSLPLLIFCLPPLVVSTIPTVFHIPDVHPRDFLLYVVLVQDWKILNDDPSGPTKYSTLSLFTRTSGTTSSNVYNQIFYVNQTSL